MRHRRTHPLHAPAVTVRAVMISLGRSSARTWTSSSVHSAAARNLSTLPCKPSLVKPTTACYHGPPALTDRRPDASSPPCTPLPLRSLADDGASCGTSPALLSSCMILQQTVFAGCHLQMQTTKAHVGQSRCWSDAIQVCESINTDLLDHRACAETKKRQCECSNRVGHASMGQRNNPGFYRLETQGRAVSMP